MRQRLVGTRALECVRHDPNRRVRSFRLQLHALLYLRPHQSAQVLLCGCGLEKLIKSIGKMNDLVIFDLDGTLLNTIGDLAVSCNAVLAKRGFLQHSYDAYCRFVGNGVMRLVERALPEELRTPETVADVRRDFVAYYTAHIDEFTVPYEGIPALLRSLAMQGVQLAVASNKFQAGTEKLVRLFFPSIPFAAVLGQREGIPLKPNPAVVEEILRATGAAKRNVWYVGDSGVDMETAAAAGVRSVGVTWGFRGRTELEMAGACHIVDVPAEIETLLQQ